MVKKKSKLGLGVLVGAVGATLAGFFLTSKEGKKLQKKIIDRISEEELDKKAKKIFGKVTKEAKSTYIKGRKLLIETASNLKEEIDKIDKDKFQKIVDDLVKKLNATNKYSYRTVKNLKDELVKDWIKITKKTKNSSSKKTSKRKKK